jgi:LysM repeat protein
MNNKNSPKSVINRFERRRQMMPFFLGALAGFLALLGIMIIVIVVAGANNPFSRAFATKTPTPTMTLTPTVTPLPTNTPTITPTSGPTNTSTPAGAQYYLVLANDTCWSIMTAFKVDLDVLLALNNLDQNCSIYPGETIIIPAQDASLPTRTPLPTDFPRGSIITVVVQLGDTLQSLADEFNSTVEDIVKLNKLANANAISPGQTLQIRYMIATRTPTLVPTSTKAKVNLVTPLPTATPTPHS